MSPLSCGCPISRAAFALGDVLGVASLKGFVASTAIGRSLDALLAKANQLAADRQSIAARFDNVALGWVTRRALGLVARHLGFVGFHNQ